MLTEETLQRTVKEFYPDFPAQVVKDLAHMMYGNAQHVGKRIAEISEKGVSEVNHEEQVVCLGTGFDWLHLPNFALIVNPVALDHVTPFFTQLKVLKQNWEENRIPREQGMLVMISTSYRAIGDKKHALLKAVELLDFSQTIILKEFPELVQAGLQIIVGTMDTNTRLFEPLDEEILKRFSKSNYTIPDELNEVGKFVLKHNKSQHDEFTSHYNIRQRQNYRENHPTEIMALKCMDGRIHLPIATETPMGIIQPMRNVGAKFHFGWPSFYDKVTGWIQYATERKRNCLILVTYHFSTTESHLGCAGHNYDTAAAKKNAEELAEEARFVYGQGKDSEVNVAVIGFNTDVDAIVLHGMQPGQIYDMQTKVSVKGESAPASAN